VPETLEKITNQLEIFETNMRDFDCFVSELSVDTEGVSVDS